MMFVTPLWAQTAAAAPQASALQSLLPFALMIAVLYFFILRPQAKRAKAHQQLLSNLKRGDEIITTGGVYGTIDGLNDQFVTLEIDSGVKMKILRRNIVNRLQEQQK